MALAREKNCFEAGPNTVGKFGGVMAPAVEAKWHEVIGIVGATVDDRTPVVHFDLLDRAASRAPPAILFKH